MQSVQQIADDIVAREGGFVNDPDDPGGATNYGVTIATLRGLEFDVDRDGDVDVDDVIGLTKDDARSIFVRHYFERPSLDLLPEPLQATVFDMYVNAGANAVKILQQLLRDMGHQVDVDGVIGPQTAASAEAAFAAAPYHLVDAYGIARRNYYYRLADGRSASRKYARRQDGGKGGWILRAEEFISPRYRLTDREHSARVAKWA